MFASSSAREGDYDFTRNNARPVLDLTADSEDEDSEADKPKSKPPRRRLPVVADSSDDDEVEVHKGKAASSSDTDGGDDSLIVLDRKQAGAAGGATARVDGFSDVQRENMRVGKETRLESKGRKEHFAGANKVDSRFRGSAPTADLGRALKELSFKKNRHPTPPLEAAQTTNLDSEQEDALRKQGFVRHRPPPPPPPAAGPSRSFQGPSTSKFFQPRPHPAPNHTRFNANGSTQFNTSSQFRPPTTFASSSDAFKIAARPIGVKERIGAQVKQDCVVRGVPIAVPTNPKPSPSFAASHHRKSPSKSIDDDLNDVLDNLTIDDGLKEDEAVAAFRQVLGSKNIVVEEPDLKEDPPPHLACKLLPHQVHSLLWLKERESGNGKHHGGLLADDMGLGKTVQMIALMLSNPPNREVTKSKTTLIVCPLGLLRQWKTEIETKTKGFLKVAVHHGAKRAKDARKLHNFDVVVTNYETVSSESTNDESALFNGRHTFYRVILDEAHTIKNSVTKTSKACSSIRAHFRWALTGTPIQNSVRDLFSLFKYLGKTVVPEGLYDDRTFTEKIGIPCKNKNSQVAFERLGAVLGSIMLQRKKTSLINGKPLLLLPKREVIESRSPFLDPDEEAFYKSIEAVMELTYNSYLKGNSYSSESYAQVLVRLLRMRQACNHPALVTKRTQQDDEEGLDPAGAAEGTKSKKSSPQSSMSITDIDSKVVNKCNLCGQVVQPGGGSTYCSTCDESINRYSHLQSSTKVTKTMQLLEQIRNEPVAMDEEGKKLAPKKCIIFSQFTSMFDVLEPFLKKGKFGYTRFDGRCNIKQKDEAIDKITNDPRTTVILISIKSGAVGLNLTMCSRVILLDLWWNPAIEQQAFDRAHRYGQKEDVKIYKLVIDGTVEDRILTLQHEKSELARSALEGGDVSKAKLSTKDMAFLFRGDKAKGGKKKD